MNSLTKNLYSTAIALSVFFLGACANMSALQTAKTLEPGKGEFSVGAGYVNHKAILSSDSESEATAPYMEFQYRRGIMENLDAGAKITLVGTSGVDVKYQFIESPSFDMAVGTSLAYLTVGGGSSGDGFDDDEVSTESSTIIDWSVPLYISKQVSDGITLYTSPKYMLRAGDGGTLNVLGITAGAKWGQNSGLMVESTYGKALGNSFQTLQFNAAFFIKGDAWL
jgi:hypothetical protein